MCEWHILSFDIQIGSLGYFWLAFGLVLLLRPGLPFFYILFGHACVQCTYCSGVRFLALPQGYIRGDGGRFRHGWFSPRADHSDRVNYTWQREIERDQWTAARALWLYELVLVRAPLVTPDGSFSAVCSDLSSPLLSSTSATVVSSGSLLYSL